MLEDAGISATFSWNDFVIDFDSITEKMVQHLLDLGHTRIAYLSGISLKEEVNPRYAAFKRAMKKCNLEVDPALVVDGIYPYTTNMTSGYWSMKNILECTHDFTAVIALNDLMAIGAIRAINEANLSIPNDISIVGCDDIAMSEYVTPPLTTLKLPAKELGIRTVYNLMQRSKALDVSKVHINLEMVVRQTTAKASTKIL